MVIRNTNDAYSMLSTDLIGGTGPGTDGLGSPAFVYMTDLDAWYIQDPDDTLTTAENFFAIRDASGTLWRRMQYDFNKATMFDDFFGDVLSLEWAGTAGTDPEALVPAIIASVNGEVRLTSGNVGGGDDAVDASVLARGLHWQADQGGLVMQAKLSISVITTIAIFVGFTDTIALEFPIHSAASADTVTDNASNACGLMFDTAMDTDLWGLIGTDGGTQTTFESSGVVPVADIHQVIRIEVSTLGVMTAYIDGTQVGTAMAAAVDPATPLTPVLAIMGRTTTAPTLDADYVFAQQRR